MPLQPAGSVNLKPVLDAIAELGTRMDRLDGRMDRLDGRVGRLEGEVKQQGILMRAMARVILPEDVLATTLSDRDLEEEIVRKDATEKREALLRSSVVTRR